MIRNFNHAICVTLSIFAISPVIAQVESDLLVTASAGDPAQLITGSEDDATGDLAIPVRVFATRVEPLAGLDQLDGDRGFFGVGDPALLPPGYIPMQPLVDLRFDFRATTLNGATSNFWYWDSVEQPAQVTFAPVNDGRTFTFQKTPINFFHATVDGSAVDVEGFVIDRTGSAGELHKHLTIVLNDADDDLATPVRPGVYLVTYTLSYPGASSDLVYEVINGNMDAGDAFITQAVEYLNELIAGGSCPGDLNGDNAVDITDLAVLLSNFGILSGAAPEDGDLNGDGAVDLSDLAALLARFGTTC